MKIISYNVNGIRAALKKEWLNWIGAVSPDVICLQEIKAHPEQLELGVFEEAGYHHAWFPAVKKGYSGVAVLSKKRPDHIELGMGIDAYDDEGRVIRADFGDLSVMSAYFPSGTSGDERQAFKMAFLDDFQRYIDTLKKKRPNLIVVGDYNICHTSIDIHNPISNANASGFKPEERLWIGEFIDSGFVDSFRHFNPEPHNYTWWSQRGGARDKNLGWRIDYQMVSEPLAKSMKRALILPEARHSDHCPTLLELA